MPSERRKKSDEERRNRSREALLEAAQRVFSRKGYHQTLISDIVAEAGVGQGTFYRSFPSKRDIFETLLDQFILKLFCEFSDMTAHLPDNVDAYRAASISAVGRMAAVIDQHREISLLFLREAAAIDREFEAKISNIYQQFVLLASFYLEHAISRGFARPCRSDVVAQSLIGIGLQLIDGWFKGSFGTLDRAVLIEEVVNFAFMGFGQYHHDAQH